MKKYTFLIYIISLLCMQSYAQVATNDECFKAINLEVSTMCSPTFHTFNGSSDSESPDSCGYNDVWYKLIVPQSGEIFISTLFPGSNDDTQIAVYSGNCNSLNTIVSCQDDNGGEYNMEFVELDGLTPGSTIYILVDDYGDGGTFSICAVDNTLGMMNIGNDECSGAYEIPVKSYCNPTFVTLMGATDSEVTDGCEYNDVWLKAIAPASGEMMISTTFPGSFDDTEISVYSGSCGNLTTLVSCQDDDNFNEDEYLETVQLTGLTPGDAIYISVNELNGNTDGSFSICISDMARTMDATNDECIDAIPLTASSMCKPTFHTFDGASDSGESDCDYNDVWFTVDVPNSGNITISTLFPGSNGDNQISIFSGSCGSLVPIINCQDDDDASEELEIVELQGRTPGETLFISVDDYDSGGTFSICAFDPEFANVGAPIPSLSFWGIIGLFLILGIIGIVFNRSFVLAEVKL